MQAHVHLITPDGPVYRVAMVNHTPVEFGNARVDIWAFRISHERGQEILYQLAKDLS